MSEDASVRKPTRKLTAILAADVAEYSRLVGLDEEGTVAALNAHRTELIEPGLAAHNGRLVKTTGDGVLAEFASVVDALRCALQWQAGMAQRNTNVPQHRRIVFRIGINLGDVIVEGDDIYGDGVNVAARLEGLAKPGAICVSRAARDQVRDKLPVQFESLGDVRVKNIARPVRAFVVAPPESADRPGLVTRHWNFWRWAPALALLIAGAALSIWILQSWHAPVGEAARTLPLPGKPSIAVLPFDHFGSDARQTGLGEAIAESIISALSKVPKIFVIARTSSFTYGGKQIKIEAVASELGVRYVMVGSVQQTAEKIRISAQLVDATTGHHLWSETFNRDQTDLFALQDEITLNVISALQIELTQGEVVRVRRRGTDNLRAWLLVNQSFDHLIRFTREENERARKLAQEALEVDPKYPEAYVRLARTYVTEFHARWVDNPAASLRRSIELVQKALELDDTYPDTYLLLSAIYLYLNRHEDAQLSIAKALSLSPNHSLAKAHLGIILTYSGQPEAAIAPLKEAMRLSPIYPDWFLSELARAYFLTGKFDEAVEALEQRLRNDPGNGEALILLAATQGAAGRLDKGKVALAKFLEPRPAYTTSNYASGEFYKDPKDLERVLSALRKVGLRD